MPRFTAEEVLELILALDSDNSGDDSSNDSISEEAENQPELDESGQEDEEEEEEPQPRPEARIVRGRNGTEWTIVDEPHIGRLEERNIFRSRIGLTRYSSAIDTPLDAFRLLLDDDIINHIVQCTNDFAHTSHPDFNLTPLDLEKFIGLLFLRGAMNQRNFPLESLWSTTIGCSAFNRTLPRDRMRAIKKLIRFDNRANRRENLEVDKFALMSFVLNKFVENCQKSYRPGISLTVDEQLFPTKARCRFTQYMPQKPDKFGIKFWLLVDVDTKFCLNVIPYLGRDEERQDSLGTHVVMKLMDPFLGKGHNVTSDNFFTNMDLAQRLLQRNTTITGTIRSNRRELPPPTIIPLHTSEFYQSGEVHLTRYQAKKKKTVQILSTQHKGNRTQPDGKHKPETIIYYNNNKFGVDILDSMCRLMSTKAGCRRWPLAVFYNILDMAGVNAWILYTKSTNRHIARRNFLIQLSAELRRDGEHPVKQLLPRAGRQPPQRRPPGAEAAPPARPVAAAAPLEHRTSCRVKLHCNKNRTLLLCQSCGRPVCGKCLANVCGICMPPPQ